MYPSGSDERIQAKYRELRDAESRRVPSFDRVIARDSNKRVRFTWLVVPVAAVALAIAVIVQLPASKPAVAPTAQSKQEPVVRSENSNVAVAPVVVEDTETPAKSRKRTRQARRPQPQQQPSDQCAEC